MTRTREEYIAIGDEFASQNVLDQIDDCTILLIPRDKGLLAANGWSAKRTLELTVLGTDLEKALRAYEAKFGMHVGRRKVSGRDIDLGKRWRLRALAIGENELADETALAELNLHAKPAGRDPATLGTQISGLLGIALKNETTFRTGGADDAFFAEGKRLDTALAGAAVLKRSRPKDLPAEHDRLDELDGRAWELLKKLIKSGKAGNIAHGDRGLASEYNLDVLYGRAPRRSPRKPPAP